MDGRGDSDFHEALRRGERRCASGLNRSHGERINVDNRKRKRNQNKPLNHYLYNYDHPTSLFVAEMNNRV
jgi:hypothetical protein